MTAIYFSSHACHASDLVEGLEEAIQRNFEKKTKRDSSRHKENKKLFNDEGNSK